MVEQIASSAQMITEVGAVAGHFADAIEVPTEARKKRSKDPLDRVRGAVVKTARVVESAGKMVQNVTTAVDHAELRLELLTGKVAHTHLGEAAELLLKHVNSRKPRTIIVTKNGKPVAALISNKAFQAAGIETPKAPKTGPKAPRK